MTLFQPELSSIWFISIGRNLSERKATCHLDDFSINNENKTIEETAIEYKELLQSLLSKPNLVIREDDILNKQ